jgi:hypothetical protein
VDLPASEVAADAGGASLLSDAASLASASWLRTMTSEPCPPRFVVSATPATVNWGSS